MLSDKCFSQCTDPVILVLLLVLQEILQTPFSNKKKKKKRKPTGSWHTRNIRVTLTGSSRIFKHMVLLIVQELCESRGGRPGLSVLTSLLVSVDVKIPCFGIGHNLSLICLMTSEDIKHQFIIIIIWF